MFRSQAVRAVLTGSSLLAMALAFGGRDGTASARWGQDEDEVSSAIAALPRADYFALRPDLRRCAVPECGGYHVRRVNSDLTSCPDGQARAECYVAELGLGRLGLAPEQEAELRAQAGSFLLRGELAPLRAAPAAPLLGRLEVSEAWRGHAQQTAAGSWYRVRDLQLQCVAEPCLSFEALRLNSADALLALADVDLSRVAQDPNEGAEQLRSPQGLMVAGRTVPVSGAAGSAVALLATEFYAPFPGRSCGGLSPDAQSCPAGEFCQYPPSASCGAADATGICTARPQSCPAGPREPVCGCDGLPYPSACDAALAGVSADGSSTASNGCALRSCGGPGGERCGAEEYCDSGIGQCGAAQPAGVCRPGAVSEPIFCTEEFDPVCGCDGKTYSNRCKARAASAPVAHLGECGAR